MLDSSFNKNIRGLFKKIAYEMFIVNVNNKYSCTCNDSSSNIGKPDCPKCLGFGKRIRIRKIRGVVQAYEVSVRLSEMVNKAAVNKYYFEAAVGEVNSGDAIVRKNDVDIIQYVKEYRSDSNDPIYFEGGSSPKKTDLTIFLKNFKNIVEG